MKIETFKSYSHNKLKTQINYFIVDKKVIDIKYQVESIDSPDYDVFYTALVMYEDLENDLGVQYGDV